MNFFMFFMSALCFTFVLSSSVHAMLTYPLDVSRYAILQRMAKQPVATSDVGTQTDFEETFPDCAICLDPCHRGTAVTELVNCMHKLHTVCLERYRAFSEVCPVCRTQIRLIPPVEAARHRWLHILQALHAHGIDVLEAGEVAQRVYSPLFCAVAVGHLPSVKFLLECGAAIDWATPQGATALMAAAEKGDLPVVKFLFDHGASIDLATPEGVTALIYAAQNGHLEVVQTLLECGAAIDWVTLNHVTALFFAAQNGHFDVVQCLLEHGADTSLATVSGAMPRDIALSKGHPKIIQLFDKHEAERNPSFFSGSCLLQ
jgi:hypothetical protein